VQHRDQALAQGLRSSVFDARFVMFRAACAAGQLSIGSTGRARIELHDRIMIWPAVAADSTPIE
jgi:hypothetical protein